METAFCIAVKGTVVPLRSETEVPEDAAAGWAAGVGAEAFGAAAAPLEATAAGVGAAGVGGAADPAMRMTAE